MIAAGLPALFFLLSLMLFAALDDWREASLKAAVVSGITVLGNTEALSAVGRLSGPWLTALWSFECLVALAGIASRRRSLRDRLRRIDGHGVPLLYAVLAMAAIILAIGTVAIVAPPNTADSMSYHLARVMHWVADESVAYYPTNILRQLYQPSWSEYAVLQLQLLSGSDRLDNLVQWFAMLCSAVASSLVARQVGAPPRGQVLAAVAVVTLPAGILQASSTQTDYVVAFWLMCAVSAAISFVATRSIGAALLFATSLGLAMLSKGTAYVFAGPLVIALGVWMLLRLRTRIVVPGAVMICVPLLINSASYIRNETTFHNPLAPAGETVALANSVISPQVILSNAIRDAVLQFGTPVPELNSGLYRVVEALHSDVLRIAINDPRTTWPSTTFEVNSEWLDEDFAGDPLQAILALVAVTLAIASALRKGPWRPGLYAVLLVAAYLAFAGYLRWQPWASRLELPLLVASGPLIGFVAARQLRPALVAALCAVLLLASIPWVVNNATRPMIGFSLRHGTTKPSIFNTPRNHLYFVKRPSLEAPYQRAALLARQLGCREIGLWSGPDDWEYPLWVLVQESIPGARVDQVFVTNASSSSGSFGRRPCLLIVTDPYADRPPLIFLDGQQFIQAWTENGVAAYTPATAGTESGVARGRTLFRT